MSSSPPSPAPTEPSIDPKRRELVDRARKAWSEQLIDRTRRNNLLYFRELKTGTLDLPRENTEPLAMLLRGEGVALNRLLPNAVNPTRTAAVIREIHRRALANLEERGLETLFLALGMVSWPAKDGGRPLDAPVLLVPVKVETRGQDSSSLALRLNGEAQVNPVLLHALEVEHGIVVSPEMLLNGSGDPADALVRHEGLNDADEVGLDPAPIFERLEHEAATVPGFSLRPRAVIGNFSFQKMAMWKDLEELGDHMAAHDVIAALAGDPAGKQAVRGSFQAIEPSSLDRVPPGEDFLVLDADASQQAVVTAARTGQHIVIQGPPGTGKSQTIANLIATLVARGKRILFVAEKRAALEVVSNRLKEVGLDHLGLDLHGADLSRREVMARLGRSLHRVREAGPVAAENTHGRFEEARERLNQHVARMHTPRPPSGKSLYELQGLLLRTDPAARASTRWRGPDLERLTAPAAMEIARLLREASGFGGLFTGDHSSPWSKARLTDGHAVQAAIDAVLRITQNSWPQVERALRDLCAATQLPFPETLTQAHLAVGLVRETTVTLEHYTPALFNEDLASIQAYLAPAGRGPLQRTWALCTDGGYRKSRSILRSLRKGGTVPDATLLQEAAAAGAQAEQWRSLIPSAGGVPPALLRRQDAEAASQALAQLEPDLVLVADLFSDENPRGGRLQSMIEFVARLAADRETAFRIPRLREIEREIVRLGGDAILNEIRSRKLVPDLWAPLFEHAWYASCFDQARVSDPHVAGFNGHTHEQVVQLFRSTDRERIELAASRVRRAHAENVIRVMNAQPEQEALVKREIEKRTRHLPLRRLLAEAPDVLTALAPCWMASPLSVSQLLAGDKTYFDVVIFDEASQVLPQDAVPSLLRARQAIVAGDEHQLPPSAFFADGGADDTDEEEDVLPIAGFESLLQLLRSSLERPLPLQWHYRSRDEALITFSNHHIYRPNGQELITFPGPGGQRVLQHVLVEQSLGIDGQEDSSAEEVRRVVQLILDHAVERPRETLGVIAMGIKHAARVQAALDQALRERPELAGYFDEQRTERFFVKNLERVQGDERDAIILTIGYGKDRSGKLPYRFGPLNQEGGERRLNVAITRARQRMTVVSSFSHYDMDPGRSSARGVELLRLYLQFAASAGGLLGDTGKSDVPLNFFEMDIYEALTRRGMQLLPQWGASRYRIDLVAQHPERPGQLVLAIECDGAAYHSAPTARDRDRLRQQQLEALGWRFHRIWSTDWFMRRDEEIERAWRAYEKAVADADLGAEGPVGGPSSVVPPQPADTAHDTPSSTPASRPYPRPDVPRRPTIADYAEFELQSLTRWLASDGRLRTDDELVEELVRELGFRKRGARIEAACRKAIGHYRSGH